jgi:hypothetical protein
MTGDARQPPTTKKTLVENGLRQLPKHCGKLAGDLLFGHVLIPARWLTGPQKTFIALDPDGVPEEAVLAAGCQLLVDVIRLCHKVIPGLIEDYLARHTALARLERDSLRRGSGPAAVRDAVFNACPLWPSEDLEALGEPVRSAADEALDLALARRRARQNPDSVDAALAAVLVADVAAAVHVYAQRRRLSREDERWLLSEVADQLARNCARGRVPQDVTRWATVTAAAKLKRRAAIDQPPAAFQALSTDAGTADHGPAVVDLALTLVSAGIWLAKRAGDLRTVGEVENAAVHDISATILTTGNVEDVTSFIEDGEAARAILDARLIEQGLNLSPGRRLAAVMLIKATLRDALTR